MDAVLIRQLVDAGVGLVVGDLGGSEKSLNRPDSPYNRVPMVLRSNVLGLGADLVKSMV